MSHYLTDLKVVAALALTRRVISSLPACSAIFIAVNPSYNANRKDKDKACFCVCQAYFTRFSNRRVGFGRLGSRELVHT